MKILPVIRIFFLELFSLFLALFVVFLVVSIAFPAGLYADVIVWLILFVCASIGISIILIRWDSKKQNYSFNEYRLAAIALALVALLVMAVIVFFLSNIFCCGPGPDMINPVEVMKENLKQVYSKGFSSGTIAKKSTFEKGNAISAKDIIGELPLDSSDVKFNCPPTDTAICGDSKLQAGVHSITSGANQLVRVQNKVEAFIAICGDSSAAAAPHYCIGFGSTAEKAVDACGKSDGCGLFS